MTWELSAELQKEIAHLREELAKAREVARAGSDKEAELQVTQVQSNSLVLECSG